MKVACLQLRTGTDMHANAADLRARLIAAADAGARLILTPEGSNVLQRDRQQLLSILTTADADPVVTVARAVAAAHGVTVVLGSVLLRDDAGAAVNRCLVIDTAGQITAHYDKIHMFDVDLSESERYRESDTYQTGDRAVLAPTPWGPLGLSICYDLRFPPLYAALARAGAQMLAIPAAFTVPTGQAHWHVLLRARAIETGSFVFAPAQGGLHADGRATYGHSLIIDPWGQVLAACDHDAPDMICAEVDLADSTRARQRVPALDNARPFTGPEKHPT